MNKAVAAAAAQAHSVGRIAHDCMQHLLKVVSAAAARVKLIRNHHSIWMTVSIKQAMEVGTTAKAAAEPGPHTH